MDHVSIGGVVEEKRSISKTKSKISFPKVSVENKLKDYLHEFLESNDQDEPVIRTAKSSFKTSSDDVVERVKKLLNSTSTRATQRQTLQPSSSRDTLKDNFEGVVVQAKQKEKSETPSTKDDKEERLFDVEKFKALLEGTQKKPPPSPKSTTTITEQDLLNESFDSLMKKAEKSVKSKSSDTTKEEAESDRLSLDHFATYLRLSALKNQDPPIPSSSLYNLQKEIYDEEKFGSSKKFWRSSIPPYPPTSIIPMIKPKELFEEIKQNYPWNCLKIYTEEASEPGLPTEIKEFNDKKYKTLFNESPRSCDCSKATTSTSTAKTINKDKVKNHLLEKSCDSGRMNKILQQVKQMKMDDSERKCFCETDSESESISQIKQAGSEIFDELRHHLHTAKTLMNLPSSRKNSE